MKKLTKIICLIMALVMTVSVFSACSSKAPAPASEAEKSSSSASASSEAPKKVEGVTLSFVASQNWVNKGCTVDSDLIKKFEEETGIKVDLQVVPDDQYVNVLKTKLSTGEVPDIFMVSGGIGAQKFLPEKYFADLSSEPWVSRYQQYALEGTAVNGKTMGLMTWNVDGWGILYNTDIYKKFNLSAPATYEDFAKNCDALLKNGITPVYEPGKESWHWAIYLSNFGPFAASKHEGMYDKLNKNEMKFAEVPEFETFLAQIKQSYDKGYFGKNCLANTWDSAYEALGTGKAAGFLGYQSYQNEVKEKFADSTADKWEMFPMPFAGNNFYSHSAGGNMRVAYKDSKNLEYVKQFFNFLTREDSLKKFYEERKDLQSNPSFKDVPGKATAAGESIIKNATGGQGMDMEYGVMFWDNTAVGKYIQEMLLGSKTPKQVLESIDNDRQKLFEATK